MKKLFILATPIGNLEDITLRALRIFRENSIIICENPRKTKILLDTYEIKNVRLLTFFAKSGAKAAEKILDQVEKNAVYVSEAGTPCISDPGFVLLQKAREKNFEIEPIPGVSALTTFLSVCGLPTHEFIFRGFLPHKKGRQTILQTCQENTQTIVFYESVHRFPRLLEELQTHLDSSHIIAVGREMTKMYEDFFLGTIEEAQQYFIEEKIKGEFVVGIAPKGFC